MYTRSYAGRDGESGGEVRIPENYSGNAFAEPEGVACTAQRCEETPPPACACEGGAHAPAPQHGGGLLGRLGLGGGSTDWVMLLLVLMLCLDDGGKEGDDMSLLLLLLLLLFFN